MTTKLVKVACWITERISPSHLLLRPYSSHPGLNSKGLPRQAIEREESKIAAVNSVALPKPIQDLIEAGELIQWRRHPTIFFVEGVGKARIIWDSEKGIIAHRYLRDIPKDQYPKFRDVFNKLSADIAAQPSQRGEA